jgi:hypothetical protein
LEEPFYVAIITPVIHYCMGGLEIDVNSSVIGKNGAIPGLYCAGEIAGGVHGNNRLGGNSLLDCVVFGRVAGRHCAKYILGDNFKPVSLKGLIPAETEKKKEPQEAKTTTAAAPAAGATPTAVAGAAPVEKTWKQFFTEPNPTTTAMAGAGSGFVGCMVIVHAPWVAPALGLAVLVATECPCLKKYIQ